MLRSELLHEDQFRDFEFEPRCRESTLRQRADHGRNDVAVLKLHGREVDRDLDVLCPANRLSTSFAQNPFADLHNVAGVFRHRDEHARPNQAARGMMPANERLEGCNALVCYRDNRLEPQAELGIRQRVAHFRFELQRSLRRLVQGRIENPVLSRARVAAPVLLGAVHGEIGAFEQVVNRIPRHPRRWRSRRLRSPTAYPSRFETGH